ncbi:MAG: hypothetical protein ACQET1_07755 [Gemmatimonadota bacterium]
MSNHTPLCPIRRPGAILHSVLLVMLLALAACQGQESPRAAVAALEDHLTERFTPGLHSLMMELQHRHVTLWFAGEAENWPLTDYFLHEMEELLEDIENLHPRYEEVPIADILGDVTAPAVEALEDAVEEEQSAAFVAAYDQLTGGCNGCHAPADKAAIVIQRPTSPSLTNLKFDRKQ